MKCRRCKGTSVTPWAGIIGLGGFYGPCPICRPTWAAEATQAHRESIWPKAARYPSAGGTARHEGA